MGLGWVDREEGRQDKDAEAEDFLEVLPLVLAD